MQAAEVLGLAAEDVTPSVVDTDSVGWTGGSGGSRITFDTGRAVISAALDAVRQMSARAALLWEVQPEDVEFADGVFTCVKYPADSMTFKELAGNLMDTGGPITCSASDKYGGVGAQLAGNIVDLEVDPETGKGAVAALYDVPGRGPGRPSRLRGRTDAGRRPPGYRLGVERGVLLRR
jgi:CO/xanthine dehydrogenase Mo-binding subunit